MKRLLLKPLFFTLLVLISPVFGMSSKIFKSFGKKAKNTLFNTSKRTIIPYKDFKGFEVKFKDDAKHLIPSSGLYHSSWLKNFRNIGNKNHSTYQLAFGETHGLFKPFEGPLCDTRYKNNPCFSLNSKLIGQFIGMAENKEIFNDQKIEPVLEVWKHEHERLTNNQFPEIDARKFIDNLRGSLKECDGNENIYTKHTPKKILWGFLAAKGQEKKDIVDAVVELNSTTPVLKENSSKLLEKSFLESNHIPTPNDEEFLEHSDIVIKNPEKTNLIILEDKTKPKNFPPLVHQDYYGFQGKKIRPDCAEAAFLYFFLNLLWNPKIKSFDIGLLSKHCKLSPTLLHFINTLTPDNVNDRNVRQQWMDLVSAQKNVVYKQKNYEIKATDKNILPVINHLFGINASNLTDLGTTLSTPSRIISFASKKDIATYTSSNTIEIIIDYKDFDIQNELKWHIEDGHTFIEKPEELCNIIPISTMHNLVLDSSKNPGGTAEHLLPLMDDLSGSYGNSLSILNQIIFAQDLQNPTTLRKLISMICSTYDIYGQHTDQQLHNFIKKLPKYSEVTREAVRQLVRNNIHKKAPWATEFVKNNLDECGIWDFLNISDIKVTAFWLTQKLKGLGSKIHEKPALS